MKQVCKIVMIGAMLSVLPMALIAQDNNASLNVSGIVLDDRGEPLAGASVVVKGTTIGVTTGINGDYDIAAPANATLTFSFLGMGTTEEAVDGRGRIDIQLGSSDQSIDEVVVVGYGTQKKVTLTGAVAGVKGGELIATKNENVQNMLTGRIAGVRVWQKTAEPGAFSNNFDIRGLGAPLVVIDGIPRTTEEFQRLNPNDIDDVSVLKDASAAIYGVRAANGVLLVTTKKGERGGAAKTSYTGTYTLQQPTGFPQLADAYGAMELFNAMGLNKSDGTGVVRYAQADFDAFRTGARPTTDWNALMIQDLAPQTQHDIGISGGSDKTQYYIGMGYFYQEGFFKTGDLNYDKYTLRSNITTELVKGLKLDLNISGIADERNTLLTSAEGIIREYWRNGVLYPAYVDAEHTMMAWENLTDNLMINPVALIDAETSGYWQGRQKYFQSAASLSYDFGTATDLLQGLSLKGLFSYDYRMDNNTTYRKEYYLYGSDGAAKIVPQSSPSQLRRYMYDRYQTLSQIMLTYKRDFGQNKLNALIGWETQHKEADNFYAQRDLAFAMQYLFAGTNENQQANTDVGGVWEDANAALIGRLNYTYADRYIAEAQFRYDGSSKFMKGNQWGFFPSGSLAWRISEEPLFKSISALNFISQLKVRASYGVLGDDAASSYQWASGYVYPAQGHNPNGGDYNGYSPGWVFDGEFVYGAAAKSLPNEAITWYTSHTFDFGVDFDAWRGLLGFAFDWFSRRREGRLVTPSSEIPTVLGSGVSEQNLNSDRQFGIDLELSHKNSIAGFTYKVKAIGTITRNMFLTAVQNGPYANSYDRWRNDNLNNRYQGVQFGYQGAGRFTSWDDIRKYNLYHDNGTLPGDYKYVDWNGDGEINGLDEHPYAYDQTPWLNYSLNFEATYKGFDLNILFQGTGMGSMQFDEPLYSIWGSYGGGALEQFMDRWHPVTQNAWDYYDPYNPSLQWASGNYALTGRTPIVNSEFNRISTAYLRLKSIELGYTLPKIKAAQNLGVRVFANAYNLLTFTKVKYVDPEHPTGKDESSGRLYPLNKTYTLGLTLSF